MKQEIEITLETQENVTVFQMKGDLTTFAEPFLREAYEEANRQGSRKILLNFSNDAYINSGGIALLIQLLSQAHQNNQQIGITGLSSHFQKIFSMVGINKFAKIYNAIEEALQDLSK